MKAVFMVAGIGKRMGALVENKPKCLIEIGGKPLVERLLATFIANGVTEIVLLVGYKKEMIVDFVTETFGEQIDLTVVGNDRFDTYNNMYTVWCARELLRGEEFVLCNGDAVISNAIVSILRESDCQSGIMLDVANRGEDIDSPGTVLEQGRITDLGRHVPRESNGGYCMGIYKFGRDLSAAFFDEVGDMLAKHKYGAGFHDPLIPLFKEHDVFAIDTNGLTWTDLDTPEDIPRIEELLKTIAIEENLGDG